MHWIVANLLFIFYSDPMTRFDKIAGFAIGNFQNLKFFGFYSFLPRLLSGLNVLISLPSFDFLATFLDISSFVLQKLFFMKCFRKLVNRQGKNSDMTI